MLFLFGSRFASSGQVFRILIFATGIIFISNLVGPAITATNRQRVNMWITFGNMVLNIVLNLFLIPRWSYIGASVATVLTEGAGCALAIFFNMRYLKIPPLSMTYFSLVKPIAAVGVMAASILYFHALNIIAVIPIAAVCYGGALLFLGWFDKLDARLFRQAVGLK
jgi:O-antigen/teichoic acid export membrane protein